MSILLSNDDGIHVPGIQQLVEVLRTLASVQIVAPDRDHGGDIAIRSGTPTDCVYIGVNTLMRPEPDIVVSGINAVPNFGDYVIYSGTVAVVTCLLLRALTSTPLPTGKLLKVNVPDLPLSSLQGYKVTRGCSRHPASEVIRQTDPRGREMLWIGPPACSFDGGSDTDFDAVNRGYVSLTPLQVDLTASAALLVLSAWLGKTEGLGPW
ncbi:5'/3'-nucleotidase SurE [Sodalis-like symbiont of Philaenus spumarius]|nr:5'/3'-nucleotidase SurE [Sodalis-like symbiont of Philaenus spumarius]